MIQFDINRLFAHSEVGSSIAQSKFFLHTVKWFQVFLFNINSFI